MHTNYAIIMPTQTCDAKHKSYEWGVFGAERGAIKIVPSSTAQVLLGHRAKARSECNILRLRRAYLEEVLGSTGNIWWEWGKFVSWCFKPSQPRRIISGAENKYVQLNKQTNNRKRARACCVCVSVCLCACVRDDTVALNRRKLWNLSLYLSKR